MCWATANNAWQRHDAPHAVELKAGSSCSAESYKHAAGHAPSAHPMVEQLPPLAVQICDDVHCRPTVGSVAQHVLGAKQPVPQVISVVGQIRQVPTVVVWLKSKVSPAWQRMAAAAWWAASDDSGGAVHTPLRALP